MNSEKCLPLIFIMAGTANVLLMKYADNTQSLCQDGQERRFQHPLVQTAFMFLGELLCYVVYKSVFWFLRRRDDLSENSNMITSGGRDFSAFSFVLPAFLDAIATVLLFTGLYLTYASSFQSIRAATIIFIGIFSSMYLNQTLSFRHWMAMFTTCCGIIVILSIDVQRAMYDRNSLTHPESNAVLTGDLLILCAQIFHAAQIVYEEKHLKYHEIPAMQAVGLEGIFGLCITILLALLLNFVPMQFPLIDNSRGVLDDLTDVFVQMHSNAGLTLALCAFIISSAFYNYAALSIVQFSSGANRILAEGLRLLQIYLFTFLLEWEAFNIISLMGVVILLMGACAYRNTLYIEWLNRTLMSRFMRGRYADLTIENEGEENVNGVPTSRPADII